jgi:hypothetical protein
MVTLAFGTALPLLSFTAPEMRPKIDCPWTVKLTQTTKRTNTAILVTKKSGDAELFRLCISNLQGKNSELKQLIPFSKNDWLPTS